MPIAQVFKEHYANDAMAAVNTGGDVVKAEWLSHGYQRSVFFDVQTAMDLMAHTEIDRSTGLGNLRLPFDGVWMEWELDDRHVSDQTGLSVHMGFLLHINNPREGRCSFDATMLLQRPSDPRPSAATVDTVVVTDEHGCFIEYRHTTPEGQKPLAEDHIHQHEQFLDVALMALSLINCRNVTTKTGYVNMRRSGAQKRRGEPAPKIRYNTIILPGGGSVSDGHGGHRVTALHRVRGHFKTFTAERPLMGQHVGTYWWGWQVRGNLENGAVVSDYKLAHR